MRDSLFIAAVIASALACGVMAARVSAGFVRWVIGRTLSAEW